MKIFAFFSGQHIITFVTRNCWDSGLYLLYIARICCLYAFPSSSVPAYSQIFIHILKWHYNLKTGQSVRNCKVLQMGLIGVLLPRVHSSLLYIGIWVLQSAKVAAVAGSQLTWLLVMVPVDLEPSHLPRLRLPRRVPLPFALPVGGHYTTTPQLRQTVCRYKSIYQRTISRYKLIPTDSSRRC